LDICSRLPLHHSSSVDAEAVIATTAVLITEMKSHPEQIIAVVIFMLHQAFGKKNCVSYTFGLYDLVTVEASSYWDGGWKPENAILWGKVMGMPPMPINPFWCSTKLTPQQISSMNEDPQFLEIHFKKEISVSFLAFESSDVKSMPSKFRILGVKKSGEMKVLSNVKVPQAPRKYRTRIAREKFAKLRIEVFATAKNADYVSIGRMVLCP